MPKGIPNRRYTGEFKQKVVEHMRENHLSYWEVSQIFDTDDHNIGSWERIYLAEDADGLYLERRGRKGKPCLPKQIQEDLLAENQRLRAEVAYLKKLQAFVQKKEQREKKRRQSGN